MIGKFPSELDLIIVEGHKDFDIPGIWLEKKSGGKKVEKGDHGGKKVVFRDDPKYLDKVLSYIYEKVEEFHAQKRVMAGLLFGGKSTRMGTSKALLKVKGKTLVERSFNTLSVVSEKTVLLGSGRLPESLRTADRLPDVGALKGPMAGMLSAFRWDPGSTWIISAVDMPLMHRKAWEWLLDQRKPGVWAVLPCLKPGTAETTGACYEPMLFEYIEALAGRGISKLQVIAEHPKVLTPLVPRSLASAWKNVNTAEEWKKLRLSIKGRY